MIGLKNFALDKGMTWPKLEAREVCIWVLCLSELKVYLNYLYSFLSQDEKKKADLFRKFEDRNRYVITRGCLRFLLGSYIPINPREVVIIYNEWGKPSLPQPYSLNFNLSHSEDLSLITFANSSDIGVDIEYKKSDLNFDDLVPAFLNTAELETWSLTPQRLKEEYFFKLWVGKEAFLKALGRGWLEKKEVAESLKIYPSHLNKNRINLENEEGVLQFFEISSDYECAYFSKNGSTKYNIYRFEGGENHEITNN